MLLQQDITGAVRSIIAAHVRALRGEGIPAKLVPTSSVVKQVRNEYGQTSTSAKQLADYVAYVMREASHVCRYAVGEAQAMRVIHVEPSCTPRCKLIQIHYTRQNPSQSCQTCNLILPTSGECGYCE